MSRLPVNRNFVSNDASEAAEDLADGARNGDLTVTGNLTVSGTTTTVSTTNLEIEDKNIELAKTSSPSDSNADGGGITLKGTTDKTILWENDDDKWHFNQGIDVIGTGSFAGAAASLSQGNVQVGVDSGGDPGGELMFHTDDYVGLRCADSGALSLAVKPSGNVGIGTTAPAVALDVIGTGSFAGAEASLSQGNVQVGVDSGGDPGGELMFHTDDYIGIRCADSGALPFAVKPSGNVGIGDVAPGTQLQVSGTAPYVTLKNSTAENTAGGCESKIIFEDHADVTLAQVEGSHSGSSDDTKGKMILSTHTGSALTAAVTIDDAQDVTFAADITADGSLFLKEKADAEGDTAAYGQLWVNTATPNELYFTTDAGDDIQLTDGTSTSGGGAVSAVANGVDNRITTFSSSTALNGEANLTFDGSTLTVAGEVSVGSGSATGVVESNGNYDLKLQTGNSTTGSITITDGANGDIAIEPNGSGGFETTAYFHHEKGIQGAYTAVTANTTLSDSHFIIQASRSAELTLPAVGSAGRWYFITRIDDGTSDGAVEIDADGSERIEGNSEYHLESDGDGVALYDNGAMWIVMWEKKAPTRAGFAPTDVENCALWLTGDAGLTKDGDHVTTWADQSGNSNDATVIGSFDGPTSTTGTRVGGLDALLFTRGSADGSSLYPDGQALRLATDIFSDNDQPWTVFVVVSSSGDMTAGTHIMGTGSALNTFLYSADGNSFGKKIFVDNSSHAGINMTNALAGTETISGHVLNGVEVIIGSYTGGTNVKLDGGGRAWTVNDDPYVGADYDYSFATIGASTGGGTSALADAFNGTMCEIIAYQRALDHSEIMLVRDYLLSRWT